MVRRRTSPRKKRAAYPSLGAQPAKRSGAWVLLILGALVLVNLYVFVWDKKTSVSAIKKKAEAAEPSMTLPSQPLSNAVPAGDGSAPVGPPGTIEGKVGKGETLGKLLKKAGLKADEGDEIIRSLSGVLDFKSIRPGQPFRIERGPDGHVKLFELELSKVQRVRSERKPSGELEGVNDNTETKLEIKSVGGTIDSSLYASIKDSGESASLVGFFVDVFAYDIDFFNDTQEGDQFRIVVEKKLAADGSGTFLGYGHILAAEYRGKAGAFQTYFWNGKYYDAKGESSERGMLKTPLKFVRVSSGFDRKRMHPVLHTVRAHLGIDYAAPVGTPVWAAASGVVVVRAPSGGAGNLVIIRHDSGIETAYMHLSKFAKIKVGQRIEAKTVIGYVGTTGLSTGPHLHFGVRKNGEYIDPTKLAPIRGRSLGKNDLVAFKSEVAKLDGQLASVVVAPVAPALATPAPAMPAQIAPAAVGAPTAAL